MMPRLPHCVELSSAVVVRARKRQVKSPEVFILVIVKGRVGLRGVLVSERRVVCE